MSQWGQGQTGYQYPLQTGFPPQNQSFQQPGFPQGGLAPQPTGFPGQRSPLQQPQPTGFPGGGLLQQTGFVGSFQQQQRPPVPPVPPLPSQFQPPAPPPPPLPPSNMLTVNPQNRLLSSSPGFGGSGLVPQQTGFPGPGGGIQPLIPQVTGFVDPRLQMMSNTFLPANPAAPYNPTGAPQLLQPQQQLGGLSLQQSFQQHNQEVKGTATPRVPWALSKAEKKSYDQIFRAWDTSSSGFIDGNTAIEVFGQSGLDRNDLARIWTLVDADNRGKLNIAEFHVAMGLIYRKLNGNEIPDELPAELVPPSHRDLDTSVNFVKNLLQNEPSRARSPSGLEAPVSRLPNRSLLASSAPGAGGRQDATVYKHTDEEPVGGYYTPRSRHLDRSAVRASSERDSPAADLNDMKRQLENTARMLDRATEESALRTAEDDALDREMSNLKWKVQRVQEDLEYASRGPRTFRADDERRRLERELLELMHERVPTVEKKLAEREERRARQKRELDRERDRRNESFGRFGDRDRDRDRYGNSYSRDGDGDRYSRSYDRDRGPDRDYRDDRSRDFDRDHRSRSRSRSWERKYDRERPRSPPAMTRTPPPPPNAVASVSVASLPPPAPPTPAKSPAPNFKKNMTPEERRAFIQAEAQRRTAERMAAMGLSATPSSTSKPTLDSSTEDRLAREKREAEEKAMAAEEAAAERARQRDERLKNERGGGAPTPASPTGAPQMSPAAVAPKVPPPVKPRAPAPPPPRKPGGGVAARSPAARVPPKNSSPVAAPAVSQPIPPVVSVQPAIDPEEEALRTREEALLKQKGERLARMRRLEEEEREEEAQRQREEATRRQRELEEAAHKAKQERLERLKRMEEEEAAESKREEEARETRRSRTPAPAPVAPPPDRVVPVPPVPPTPPIPPNNAATPVDRGKNNPFNRLISGGASPAAPTSPPNNGGNNPFFRPQPVAPSVSPNNDTTPLPPFPSAPAPDLPPPPKSPVPSSVKTSYHTAPGDSDDEWGQEKDEDNDSSEDELDSSRDTRDKLARQLFSSILPPANIPSRPQSAAAGASSTPKAPTPAALSAPTPPPPPPAPPAPAAPAASAAPVPTGDRGALLNAIQNGTRLRKAVTNDRSVSAISGRVLGDVGPPPHVSATSTTPPAETSLSENGVDRSRQSVDWYMGLAADQGPHASQEPKLPSMGEEDEEQARQEMNGHAAPVPDIRVAHAEEVQSDLLEDIDHSTEYRVRTLYPYDGHRAEDLSFGENVVITAHASKSGGDWWYGTVVSNGKAGFFPKTYVQTFKTAKAKGLYDYPGGSADELPFSEGDEISVVDRSDGDWYKAEKDGVIFIVPAAYLEVEDQSKSLSTQRSKSSSLSMDVGLTSRPPQVPSSPSSDEFTRGSQGNTNETESESASDGTATEYHSFSDSDVEDEEAAMTEEERKLEREMRAAERQLVLEAAGIIVKKDATRRPSLRLQRRRAIGSVQPKHRPAPAPPPAPPTVPTTSQGPDLTEQPPTPAEGHLDDAYERYEAFKQHASRSSISSIEQVPPYSPASINSGSLSLAIAQSRESLPDKEKGKEGVSTSQSYGSRISQLLTRSRTPVQDKEIRSMPKISAPVMSTSSSGTGTLAQEDSPGFGLSWASLVDRSALEGLPDRERRRQEAIFELIATEGAYVRDLQLVVEIFYSSMLRLLEPKTIAIIFSNVEDILLTNTTFISSLEERQRSCRLYIDTIGDILDKHLVNMINYKDYCVNQANAIRVLQSVRDENADAAALLQRLREDPVIRNLDLSSYLLVPMQRITRYPLLIKQILQYTEPDQDREPTERALHTAEMILDTINEAIREREGRDRLKALSQDLWIGQGRLDLTAPTRHLGDRKLFREGLLTKTKSGRKLRAFLCNDILLLTDEHGKTLYRMPIPLSEIHVEEGPSHRDELSFQLSVAYPRGGDKITLRASSARERQFWMTDIERASWKCKDAEKAVALKARLNH